MLTCRKIFRDIPFAHRQFRHAGHCAFIHGHNWSFAVTFACRETDEHGFVVDFGNLGYLKEWLETHLDHAMVFSRADPLREILVAAAPEAWKVYVLDECSCEGIARHVFVAFDALVRENTSGRAWVRSLELLEDGKNSARWCPEATADD